jgi:endogenous inhibitor of DNA gyrase (YacG/DUF329 family)
MHRAAADKNGHLRLHRVRLLRAGVARVRSLGVCPWCGRKLGLLASGERARHAGYCSFQCRRLGERDAKTVIAKGIDLKRRKCAVCRKPLPPTASVRRKFCGGACRIAAHRQP